MLAHQVPGPLFCDHHCQGRGSEIVLAAEEDLPSAILSFSPDDTLGPVAGIAGVETAIIEPPHPKVAAQGLKAPAQSVPHIEVDFAIEFSRSINALVKRYRNEINDKWKAT